MPHPLVVHCQHGKPYDVYVGRPSIYGNKYVIGPDGTREEVIAKYRQDLLDNPEMIKQVKRYLRGKVLACWCAPLNCHADVLAEVANDS